MMIELQSQLKVKRGPGVRLSKDRLAEYGQMTREQFLVLMGVEQLKSELGRNYITPQEFFQLCWTLGYRPSHNGQSLGSDKDKRQSFPEEMFLTAINVYRRLNRRPFPRLTEWLWVLRRLGYRKVRFSSIDLPAAEDWLETTNTQ